MDVEKVDISLEIAQLKVLSAMNVMELDILPEIVQTKASLKIEHQEEIDIVMIEEEIIEMIEVTDIRRYTWGEVMR